VSAEEKTETPTPQKEKENRKEGKIPRTQDLGAWGAMLCAALCLGFAVPRIGDTLRELLVRSMAVVGDPEPAKALGILSSGLMSALLFAVVTGSVLLFIAVAANAAQGGVHLASKAAMPKFSRLNPIQGFKRIFGLKSVWEALKILLKTGVVGIMVYRSVTDMMPALTGLAPIEASLQNVIDHVVRMMRDVSIVGLVLAGVDYMVQKRTMRKQTYMTKDEVKREHKNSEGDPHLKGAIRQRALAMSANRMMADIQHADVVVVNPIHYAVALRYQPEKGAPRVVAKGAGAVALRIRAAAEEHRVATVEDVPLARALHAACELGQEVPTQLFEAVAQVLAFVMSHRSKGFAAGHYRSPRPAGPLPEIPKQRNRRTPQVSTTAAD
jgi:flagellar biosynthetic protein FlhB